MFQIDNSATGSSNNAFSDLVFYIYHAADLTTKLKFDIANTAGVETLFKTQGTANQTLQFPDGNMDLLGYATSDAVIPGGILFRAQSGNAIQSTANLSFDPVGDTEHGPQLSGSFFLNTESNTTTTSSYGYAVDFGQRISNFLTIQSGSPVSDTDYFQTGLVGTFEFNDDYSIQPLTLAGVVTNGTYSVFQGAAGKTAQKVSGKTVICIIGSSAVGGVVTDLSAFDAQGILDLSGGGTTGVTNYYAYKSKEPYGYTFNNHWGIHIEGAGVENYLETSLAIGTASRKVANSSVGLEIGGTSKALRVSNMTTTQKNALTPLAGMLVQDTTLNSLSVYNGSSWAEPLLNPMTTGGDIIYGGASGVPTRLANGTSGYYLKSAGGTSAPSWSAFTPPTVQRFTSGSGTYTTPAGVKYIRVRMVGGGGGGAGGGTFATAGDGGDGTDSTFGTSSLLKAGKGFGGIKSGAGGASDTVTIASPAINMGGIDGGASNQTYGMAGTSAHSATVSIIAHGGSGAGSVLFGGGGGGSRINAGNGAFTNTGGGGQGGCAQATGTTIFGGGGGGSGGCVDAIIPSPSATYAYVVGAGGSAGTAGTSGSAGGAGAGGLIVVVEYYQ